MYNRTRGQRTDDEVSQGIVGVDIMSVVCEVMMVEKTEQARAEKENNI